jgi:mRNA-degrading endonuclease RelE of RelBE toxin-antitoxin system
MTFRRTVGFKRELRALPLEIQRIASAKFRLFQNNWRHPSLHVHKLEGVLWHGHQVFDLYVTDRYRVLFAIDHDVIVSYSIGPHSIVSK